MNTTTGRPAMRDDRGGTVNSAIVRLIFLGIAGSVVQAHPSASSQTNQLPAAISEMECQGSQCTPGVQDSGKWEFHGYIGNGEWTNGATAKLVIKQFDAMGVDIRRIDLQNSLSYGLTAVYSGTIHGDHIEGTVVWSWNGHWNDQHPTGHWSATIGAFNSTRPFASTLETPASLTECESNQCAPNGPGGCRWRFHGEKGESKCNDGAVAKLEVRQFDSAGIVVFRTDLPGSKNPD